MLTCGLKADAYFTTQAMKSHLDQVGGCVVSIVVKRAVGAGHLPCPQLCWMQAGTPGAAVEANHLPPVPSRKAGVELAPASPPRPPKVADQRGHTSTYVI